MFSSFTTASRPMSAPTAITPTRRTRGGATRASATSTSPSIGMRTNARKVKLSS
jgi:hypothetical protein